MGFTAFHAPASGSPTAPPIHGDARETSAKDRILDAALDLFGARGFDAVSVKAVAELAEVSPSLVMHHFGTKHGLKRACDRAAAERFCSFKEEAVEAGTMPSALLLELARRSNHVVLYLFRAFVADGDIGTESPTDTDELFDRLVEDSFGYTRRGEELGLVHPCGNPRNRAVILLVQGMGTLLLHRQLKRHLGVDPVFDEPEALLPYFDAVMDVYARPVLDAEAYSELLSGDAAPESASVLSAEGNPR